MNDRELLKLALEALEYHVEQTRPIHKTSEAITALRAALAAPVSDTLPPLLPCPFCGKAHTLKLTSAQELEQQWQEDPEPWMHSDTWAVMCDATKPDGPGGCGASGGFFDSEREAVDAWNRRAALAEPVSDTLPPLPEPKHVGASTRGMRIDTYTADQMIAFRAEGIAAAVAEPVASVTECEACFTPDVCQLRGTCDHYAAERLRVAAPPQREPVAVAEPAAWKSNAAQWLRSLAYMPPGEPYFSNGMFSADCRDLAEQLEAPAAPPQREPLTRQQIDDLMTQHYPLDSLLRENVDAFEACVRDIERALGISAPASAPKEQA